MKTKMLTAPEVPTIRYRCGMTVVICVLLSSCTVGSSFNATIRLSGQVEDEEGRPLEGVHLSVMKSRVSLLAESFLSSSETHLVLTDGQFRINCRTCSGVRLHVDKDGYYSETRDFNVRKVEQPGNRTTPEVATNLERADLHIVLRSAQNKVRLVSYEGYLRSTASGPVNVAPMRRDLGSRGVPLDRLSRPPSKNSQYMPGFVSLLAAVTDDGMLATASPPDAPRVHFPAPPVLDFSEVDGGLILHKFGGQNPQTVYRTMQTAPADGYQSSLLLDSADRNGIYYFFCRIGDRYGKGFVVVPSFGHMDGQEKEVVGASIEIRLNPDGSRNVETAF